PPGFFSLLTPRRPRSAPLFSFHDSAATEIYTLSLHDALPIYGAMKDSLLGDAGGDGDADELVDRHLDLDRDAAAIQRLAHRNGLDRKSTRLNSSHVKISYAVFCLKKKNHSQAAGREPHIRGRR